MKRGLLGRLSAVALAAAFAMVMVGCDENKCSTCTTKACPAGCTKPCCAEATACPEGCPKGCCKDGVVCSAECRKTCCKQAKACPADCKMACCKKT